MTRPRFTVGLTGGIGCGKTTVADMFAELGVSIVDTDQIAHSLTAPRGPAMPAIIAEFGPEFATRDGSLDRPRMRQLVFSDPLAKQRLEAILHPRIRASADQAAAQAPGPYVIMAVPLLIESGTWRERVDRVLAIDCSEETQVRRVMTRSGLTEAQIRAIMATQVTRRQRLAAADDVIVNEDGIEALPPQVSRLHAQYLKFSGGMAQLPMDRL